MILTKIELIQKFIYSLAGKENMVKIMIENKPDLINLRNEKGRTPLFLAIEINGKF